MCLDDGEVIRINSFDRVLYHLETIDIENDEYMFWDAAGQGLRIFINGEKVSSFERTENKVTLQQAFEQYARQLRERGVSVESSGTPEEVWTRIEKAKESLPRPCRVFSRFFGRKPSK